ncbi:hypothetical protein CYFUS_004803 [Cystobacter fuscus]|uniref:Uncharacterized protein n=1 Tax=Cystobacter fuscus TaxID=43 RepID=A0A250J5Z7_9BACT|nr:hypothetical protein [Cystobacter fuscus]ATB39359.1 hypothetical protein CYFUS_004803 [Cystobacter fuscus]
MAARTAPPPPALQPPTALHSPAARPCPTPRRRQLPPRHQPPGGYPLHTGIRTTVFWAGELASPDNGYTPNVASAWQNDWQSHFGGFDDPDNRCGYNPCAFTPLENAFYFALPFSDYGNNGPKKDLGMVYWSNGKLADGQSILKNRWIQITANGRTVYAQWEDVGPFNENDSAYVFGSAAPKYSQAGLDVSPAVSTYLGMGGSAVSSWKFVDASDVPSGPWKTTITTSGPGWN